MSLFPFAIVLQVTPIVAIFPLINIYVDNQTAKLLLCSVDRRFLPDPLQHHAGSSIPWPQSDRSVPAEPRHPLAAAMAFAAACRDAGIPRRLEISGGLSLIGAVVAEFVAGSSGPSRALPTASSKPAIA